MLPGRIRVKRESVFECDLNLFGSEHIIKIPICKVIGVFMMCSLQKSFKFYICFLFALFLAGTIVLLIDFSCLKSLHIV